MKQLLVKFQQTSLFHNLEQVRSFYEQFPKAIVGVEASSTAVWFEQLLAELGHELKVGNPSLIRARARSRRKAFSALSCLNCLMI
jgi:transposase